MMPSTLRVQVVQGWPRCFEQVEVELPAGATLEEAMTASGLETTGISGYAIHGERATAATPLRDGDRVELLRPLQVDPKEARRRRAADRKS